MISKTNSMERKPRVVVRILAAFTMLEALGGLFLLSFEIPAYFPAYRRFGFDYPRFSEVYWGLALANLVLVGLLFASAWLLWRLRRRGLFLLVITLCLELLYFVGLTIGNMNLDRPELAMAAGALTGVGMMVVGLQVYTAYPLVALVLIIMAYRYLGIPARASQTDSLP